MRILKLNELKSNVGKILEHAIRKPQYIKRSGILLVIMKADLEHVSPWELRAKNLESFYRSTKVW